MQTQIPYILFFSTICIQVSSSSFKQNIVLLYIENMNEIMKVLKLLDPENSSKDVLGNIRKLYDESIHFHNVYGEVASASNFAALLTGKPAVDLGIIRGKMLPFDYFPSIASTGGLKTDEVTLAEALKDYGYRTWFTGYWKLGLGPKGDGYPIKHGFDTWMGVAHPHDEWCRRKDTEDVSKESKSHPYMNLLYKISFIWSLVFVLLSILVWLKFISMKLFINLIIYTFSTSFAFYILLHLFMIQRSASCVLYYHDFIYQQPYDARNLTLHFTQHASKLIDITAGRTPFFMVLNYLKMKPPHFHSNYFRTKSTNIWSSSLLELDWSIGQIINKLKEGGVYNETVLIMTGNNNCELNVPDKDMMAYERYTKNDFREVTVPSNTVSNDCLYIPFFIKDNHNDDKAKILTTHVREHVSVTDVFQTILDLSSCDRTRSYPRSLVKLYRKVHCAQDVVDDINDEMSLSDTAIASLQNYTIFYNSSDELHHSWHKGPREMQWHSEIVDDDVMVEAYIDSEDAANSMCLEFSRYNKHYCLFHYYNVQKPMAVTYKGLYKIVYTKYYGGGSIQKLDSPIIIDLQNNNASQTELEEVYENVTNALQTHLRERQSINTYSSEFEMPVYPWLLPCANFPRCETVGEFGTSEFSELMSSVYDDG